MDRIDRIEAHRQRLLAKLDRQAPEGWDDFTTHLRRIYEEEKRRHWSLLSVHEIDPADGLTVDQRLVSLGYPGYSTVWFDGLHDEGEYGGGNDSPDGGSTLLVRDGAGNERTLVLINRKPDRAPAVDALGIAVFYHEVGHVDDIEKRKFLVPGRTVDFVEAEIYAHGFACRRMIKGNFRFSLAMYLDSLEEQTAKTGDPVSRAAAHRFRGSGEYRNAVQFAGRFYKSVKEK